jgi:hypothetical protein
MQAPKAQHVSFGQLILLHSTTFVVILPRLFSRCYPPLASLLRVPSTAASFVLYLLLYTIRGQVAGAAKFQSRSLETLPLSHTCH